MNLEAAIAQVDAEKVVDEQDRKMLFIMPSTTTLPNDGMLEYVTVESIYDFAKINARAVVQVEIEHYDMLRVVVDNQVIFGVVLRVLTGVPTVEYDVQFDQATWNVDKVAYAPLVSELALEIDLEAQTKAANASIHDREREQVTRADGTVKRHKKFDLAKQASDLSDAEFEDNDA